MRHTVQKIIEGLGAQTIAAELAIPVVVVRMWKHRQCIPPKNWPALLRAFPDLTIEALDAANGQKAAA